MSFEFDVFDSYPELGRPKPEASLKGVETSSTRRVE